MTALRFHFDFLSPYAYLAWTQLPALAARHGLTIEPAPVVLGAMLDAFGTVGPAEVEAKRRYTYKDVLRKAHLFGVPLAPPPVHPFAPLLPLRVASVPSIASRVPVVDALFRAVWGAGRPIDGPEAIAAVLRDAGLDESLLQLASSAETKATLAGATRDAIESGIFGVPTMSVRGEPFWGVDALPSLEAFLRGEDPITPAVLQRVDAVVVGVRRPSVAGRAPAR